MKELLMEFLGTILEVEQHKAVKIGKGEQSDRIVYFKSSENMQQAITARTHRAYNPATDSNLPTSKSSQPPTTRPKPKGFRQVTKASQQKKLEEINTRITDYVSRRVKSEKQRQQILDRTANFVKLWDTFLNADDEQTRVKVVKRLVTSGFIQTDHTGNKIYISENLPLPYYAMLGSGGAANAVTTEMMSIVKQNNLPVTQRDAELTNKMNDAAGKLSENLTAHFLNNPNNPVSRKLETALKDYEKLGGDSLMILDVAKSAARKIRETLNVSDDTQLVATVVGGLGSTGAREFGIDKLSDPTDIIVTHGDTRVNFSLKLYTNVNDITIKNLGTGEFGQREFGEPGATLDKFASTYNPANHEMKTAFKQEYLEKLADFLKNLDEQQLISFWQKQLGCSPPNANKVEVLIMNRKTKEASLEDMNKLCTTPKITISYNNNTIKLLLDDERGSKHSLSLYVKTETGQAPKLMIDLLKGR